MEGKDKNNRSVHHILYVDKERERKIISLTGLIKYIYL